MSAISVSIHRGGLDPELRGKRAFILHDFQCKDFEPYYKPRVWDKKVGLPETEKLGDAIFEQMSEAWQWFWYNWLDTYTHPTITSTDLKRRWKDLTDGAKAFTNKHGSDQYADYINGANLEKAPMAQENVTTAGNIVVLTGNHRSMGGKPFWGVWCLDRLSPPPNLDENHPARDCFIHAATVCRPEPAEGENFPRHAIAPNGTYVVNNFPHCDGNKVPVPFVSARGAASTFMGLNVRENWIWEGRLCPLDDDEFPAPTMR
jgi:hypothetical protein